MANNNDNFSKDQHPVQVLRPHPEDVWIFHLKDYVPPMVLNAMGKDFSNMQRELGLKKVILLMSTFGQVEVKREPLTVIEEVAAMREKQISKGYDAAHDDEHDDESLALTGAYLAVPSSVETDISPPDWACILEQENDPRECLIIAAALLIAEVERMDRAELKNA